MLTPVQDRKAFRYRIYPSEAQVARLLAWENALRFLWNIALEQRRFGLSRSRDERRYYSAFDQINELTELRAELPWLADVPRNVCAQLLVELDKAWQRCFKRLAKAPRFKRKGSDALGLCEPHPKVWRLDGATISFPKLGNLRAVIHRPIEGAPKTCTIKRDGDQWFASIICELKLPAPAPRIQPLVALDRGIVNVVADSDGNIVESPRFYTQAMNRLARAQRIVCRRKKGSKNREKAKARVARLHRKVRRQREHFLHVLSAAYAKSHGTVVVERLQIKNMVQANRGMARGVLDAGWGRLIEYLRYKLVRTGGRLVEVPAQYSSQTCHACTCVDRKNRRTQMLFQCVACGLIAHADVNAAKVLKQRFEAPGNPWCLPVEGSVPEAARRNRKRLNVPRRSSERSAYSRRA